MWARRFKNFLMSWRGWALLLVSLAIFILLLRIRNPLKNTNVVNPDMKIFLLNELANAGFNVQMSRILIAQAAHETGNFTSKIFRENNNLFGMKNPAFRKTTSVGEKYGHAVYKSLTESIEDIALYFKSFALLTVYKDCDSYVETIKEKGYFTADKETYKEKVNYFYNLYFGKGK